MFLGLRPHIAGKSMYIGLSKNFVQTKSTYLRNFSNMPSRIAIQTVTENACGVLPKYPLLHFEFVSFRHGKWEEWTFRPGDLRHTNFKLLKLWHYFFFFNGKKSLSLFEGRYHTWKCTFVQKVHNIFIEIQSFCQIKNLEPPILSKVSKFWIWNFVDPTILIQICTVNQIFPKTTSNQRYFVRKWHIY